MTSGSKPLSLKVSEIFFSLQGEASRAGLPTVFVRLAGCPLRCVWCDTEHAFADGRRLTLTQILESVGSYQTHQVCVTGGEPLAQKNCLPLLAALCDAGYEVCLETSGALDIAQVDARVSRIVDLKAPGSGESAKNRWANLALLTARDELKLVIKDRAVYANAYGKGQTVFDSQQAYARHACHEIEQVRDAITSITNPRSNA